MLADMFVFTGTEYEISFKYPPKNILVEVPGADPLKFENCTIVPGKVVIPLEVKNRITESNIKGPGLSDKKNIAINHMP